MPETEKGKHTLAEILSQADVWREALRGVAENREMINAFFREAPDGEAQTLFTGCGSSYNLAMTAATTFNHIVEKDSRAVPSSEVFLFPHALFRPDHRYRLIPLSRSGETSEAVLALDYFQENVVGDSLALTCYENSPLARKADHRLVAKASWEKSVVMTRSFTSILLMIQAMASLVASDQKYQEELQALSELGEKVIADQQAYTQEIADKEKSSKFIFLGSGPYYGLAWESSLKIKEMAITDSETYHFLEFRHGPISIVGEGTLVIGLVAEASKEYEKKLFSDVRDKGARTLVICEKADDQLAREADYLVELNSGLSDFARSILYMPVTQLFACYTALARGEDPDHPRHLSQVVKI